jgi:hypothetical protein
MKAVEKFIEYLEVNWPQVVWKDVYKQKGQFFIEMEKELTNKRVIEELDEVSKKLMPTIRKEYRIGEFPDRDTQRFIEGVHAAILTLHTRIEELKQPKCLHLT